MVFGPVYVTRNLSDVDISLIFGCAGNGRLSKSWHGNDSPPVRGAIYKPIAQYHTASESTELILSYVDVSDDHESAPHRRRIPLPLPLPLSSFSPFLDTHESNLFTYFTRIYTSISRRQNKAKYRDPSIPPVRPPRDVLTDKSSCRLFRAKKIRSDGLQLRSGWA